MLLKIVVWIIKWFLPHWTRSSVRTSSCYWELSHHFKATKSAKRPSLVLANDTTILAGKEAKAHYMQQLIGGKFTNFRQLLVITCKLLRKETDHSVMTYAPTQVNFWGRNSNTSKQLDNVLWVVEAGNWPIGYDPRSYTSHHRQQLMGAN